ncbi:MAG: surfeit locus 1 family protein [Gammaproteobacteria bacterium]|jgi:surfeit locus 1 family protein
MAAFLVMLVFLLLGFWQLERASYKETEFESYQLNASLDPVVLNEIEGMSLDVLNNQWRKVEVLGSYAVDITYLLDNQVVNGNAGYYVYSPFKFVNTEKWILINRGWIAGSPYRDQLPEIIAPERFLKLLGDLSSPKQMSLPRDAHEESFENGIKRVQNIDLETIRKSLGYNIVPYVIRLDQRSPSGYLRNWPEPGSDKDMHLGYAFQWFLLAGTLVILYFSIYIHKQ